MRRRQEPKFYGPYEHGDNLRVHVVTGRGATRKTRYRTFTTRGAADAYINTARGETQGRTVSQAIEAFLAVKRVKGLTPATLESYEDRLAMLLGAHGNRPIRWVAGRGAELYAAAQIRVDGKGVGKRRAADTHRNALAVGKQWGRWCVRQRWLRADPFADVEPAGARSYGADKSRLTVDESRQLDAWCHAHAPADTGAIVTLGYLLLGPRATELVGRHVRDVDDRGRLLWVRGTKTATARRRLLVPDELAVYLVALAAGRPGDERLFVSDASRAWPAGRPWTRHMAHHHVRRCCRAAGVPDLAPQALRRTQSTLATEAGATGLMVAQHLGHAVGGAPAVTGRSYVGREAAADAKIRLGLSVIQGGRR